MKKPPKHGTGGLTMPGHKCTFGDGISEAQRLRSEVNSLVVSSSSGSGEGGGSEELRNVRIGYDGTEYETAGIAVREQIKALNDMIVSTEDFLALFGFDDAGDVAVEVAKPVISGVSSSTNSITVRWNTVANAQYYTVERRTVNSDWAVIASDYTGTSYLDADVAAGTNYQYAITACRSDGSGGVLHSDRSYASVTIAIEDTTVPVAPASVVATAGNNYITVQWSAVSNANYYVIRRKTAGSSAWTTLSSGATGTGYTDRTAAVGTGYQYGVVACRKSASGNMYSSVETVSNTATIEDTSAADEAPSAPANVTAYWNANEGRVYVSWSSVSGVSYTLERKEGDDAWEELSLTNSNFYEDSNVTAGTNYQYRVIAHKIGSSGQTLDSDPVTVSAAVSGSNADGKTTWGDTSKISAAQQVVDEITVGWNLANQTYHAGNGNEATTTQLQRLNAFNNTFIKAVRNAGGEYNRNRVLSCETFGAVTTDFILEPFSLSNVPESFRSSGYCLTDSEISSENSRIILQAHYYNNVPGNFQSAAQRAVAKGLPAIFGEVGWHTDSSAPSDLYNFGKNLVQQAKSEGVKVFWWDNNKTGTGKDCYGMLNRWNTKNGTAVWDKEALKNGLIDGSKAAVS